ncbi:hypothetical protein D3C86_1792010 [compost metagenome]
MRCFCSRVPAGGPSCCGLRLAAKSLRSRRRVRASFPSGARRARRWRQSSGAMSRCGQNQSPATPPGGAPGRCAAVVLLPAGCSASRQSAPGSHAGRGCGARLPARPQTARWTAAAPAQAPARCAAMPVRVLRGRARSPVAQRRLSRAAPDRAPRPVRHAGRAMR